ncbi:phage tail tape measure protein [Coprococcus catus]|uniref:phage tail tape measure protein n=1 Tax=Coprococcus catus TaxID=116085 RepID=UPI001C0192D2|nr:phage tail tape measure protein [Coprococcus catus]MBT9768930.1 phage tail tape measure protein [Coprococcus catus]
MGDYSVKAVLSAVDRGFTSTLNNAGRSIDTLSGKISSGLGFGILTGIGQKAFDTIAGGAKSLVSSVVSTGMAFESSMSNVQALSGATGADFEALSAKAQEMGAKTKFSASEAADAMGYMAMAGWNAKDMLNGIEGVMNLAAASGEDLASVSDIVTDAMTAFGLAADGTTKGVANATYFADTLAATAASANTNVGLMGETFKYVGTMAGSLGYSIEDVSLAIGLMANRGLKGSMAGTSLNSVMTRLATNTSGAREAIEKLGVKFYDSSGNARALGDVMTELRDATKGMNNEQKTALANTVAGMEAQKGLLAILNATDDEYNSLADSIKNSTGAAQKQADVKMDNLYGDVTRLKSAWDGLSIKIYTAVNALGKSKDGLGSMRSVVQSVTDIVNKTADAVENLSNVYASSGLSGVVAEVNKMLSGTSDGVKNVGAAIAGIGAVVGANAFFSSGTWFAVSKGIDVVNGGFGGLVSSVASSAKGFKKSASSFLPFEVNIRKSIASMRSDFRQSSKWISSLGEATSQSLQAVSSRFATTGGNVKSALDGISGHVRSFGDNLARNMWDKVNNITTPLKQMSQKASTILKPFSMVGSVVGKALSTVAGAAVNLGAKTASGLTKIMGLALKALMPAALVAAALAGIGLLYSQFGTQIDQMLSMAQAKGPQIITNLVNGISSRLPDLIQQGGKLVSDLLDTITANLPAVLNGGVTLVQSLVSGLISALPSLATSATNMISTLLVGIASALPSLIVSGMQLLLALAQGIANNLPTLINSAVTAISTFAQGFIQNLPTILTLAAQIIGTLAQGLISAIPQLISAIPQVVSSMIDTIMSTDWLAVGSQIVSAIGEGIFGGLAGIGGKIGNFFGSISDWFAGGEKGGESVTSGSVSSINAGIPQVSSAATSMGTAATSSVASGMQSSTGTVTSAAQSVVTSATNTFSAASGTAMTAGSSIGQSLSSGLQGSVGSINNVASTAMNGFNASLNTGGATAVSNAGKIARNIVTAFKPAITGARTSGQTIGQNFATAISSKSGAVSSASGRLVSAVRSALSNVSTYQYGAYIGQGLANGIWSQLGNVRAAANALVAQAERAIRAKAMIHSPSKLTYQLGEYFGEGFTNGIKNLTKDAWKAASDLVSIPAVNVPQMALAGWDTTLNDEYFYNDSAEYVIYVPVEIDGKEVATVTAPYTEAELTKRQKYRNRKQGIR